MDSDHSSSTSGMDSDDSSFISEIDTDLTSSTDTDLTSSTGKMDTDHSSSTGKMDTDHSSSTGKMDTYSSSTGEMDTDLTSSTGEMDIDHSSSTGKMDTGHLLFTLQHRIVGMQAFAETQSIFSNPKVVFIASCISWFLTDSGSIAEWVFFFSTFVVYCFRVPAQPIHSSLQSYSGSISDLGDVVMELLCGLLVGTFIILGLFSVWNITSNKIFLENQAREEAQLAADAERFQRRARALEAQRQELIQANINRREREALEQATQEFLEAKRPETPSLARLFTPSPAQQKPSEWLIGRYIPGRRWEDMTSRSIPTKYDNAAWLRRSTWRQTPNQAAQLQTESRTEEVRASAGPVAKFLRKKKIERERLRELVEKKIEQAGRVPPEDVRDWIKYLFRTLGSARATRRPKSPEIADAPSGGGSDDNEDPYPPSVAELEGDTQALAGPGAVGTTSTRADTTGVRLFTPYEQQLLREAMEGNQKPHSVQSNLMPAAESLNTPHGHQHTHKGKICSCGLTPILGSYETPMASESWPRYPLVHQKTCPKSPYFRPSHPTPGAQLGNDRKTMNGFNTGLTPFLPNQAGPSKLLGNPFSPVKTKFYNTKWNNVHFEVEQINQTLGNGVQYPDLSSVVPEQNTGKTVDVILDTGLITSKHEYREPAQVPLPIHTDLEEWEKRYLSADLRAKNILKEGQEREAEEKQRADELWTETAQRQKEWWKKQREENEQKLIQTQQERREREEIQRRIEEEREMESVAEQQRVEEQAILGRLVETERKENMARSNQEAAKRLERLRELEKRKQKEQMVQEEYQRWRQQERETQNRWEQEAERARLLQQQQQQEYQERLRREAEQERLQHDIAEQEWQQWIKPPQRQEISTNSSPGSMVTWTTAPMHSLARPDNNASGGGWSIVIDQMQAGQNPVTPQTNSTSVSTSWSDGIQRSDTTPISSSWGTSPGAAPKREVQWTTPFRRSSFFSAGIPVTIEEESESMDLDAPQSTEQAPLIPRHIFGSKAEIVPVNFSPPVSNTSGYTQQYGNDRYHSSSQQVIQPPVDVPAGNGHWWQNSAEGFWRHENQIQPGLAPITPTDYTPESVASHATRLNFFHAKRHSGSRHRSVTPKWKSSRTAAGGPYSDPGTDLARQASMKVLDLGELVLMRQRQRQLQQLLNSKRIPNNAVEELWIEEGLRYDTRTGGFAAVVDVDV
ncbi:hypothetical protein EV426DRAFT_576412 [Tirmania nivea]|nr:hypothetical protein EV426DRAFT_576412 [Tirmania nivea]